MVSSSAGHQQKPHGTCTNNLSPHSKRSVTRSTYLIQLGVQHVYNLIAMLMQTFIAYVWLKRLKAIKVKALNFLINAFYSFEQAKCWGVRLTIKLLINIPKSAWLEACSWAQTGASSWLSLCHLNFLQESCKAAAWWEHCRSLFLYLTHWMVFHLTVYCMTVNCLDCML